LAALVGTWAAASASSHSSRNCTDKFILPASPQLVTEHNGVQLQDVCIDSPGPHHVFAIGDWGGIVFQKNIPPVPADKRSKLFKAYHRTYVHGVDDRAQLLVAAQMRARATVAPPDYILNAGDNFYWGGVDGMCGGPPVVPQEHLSAQWERIFENVYWGPGLSGKPWLGVLGNHDYGGYKFTAAWEQIIGYSWAEGGSSTGRWFTPALYWAVTVKYIDLSVDYIFVDSNAAEAWAPDRNPTHNLCGKMHSGSDASCGKQGPETLEKCSDWFWELWHKQFEWMEKKMESSRSTYLIVTTHFPPKWFEHSWNCLSDRYGVDLFVTGHVHHQSVYGAYDGDNLVRGTCVIITGGGGGITSEGIPAISGFDDMYGFVDIELTPERITLKAISHGGITRRVVGCENRKPINWKPTCGSNPDIRRKLEDIGPGLDLTQFV